MNDFSRGSGAGRATGGRSVGVSAVGAAGPVAAGSAGGVTISGDAAFIGIACIAVATAQLLGVYWLREPLLGIPAGLWFIAASYTALRMLRTLGAAQKGADSGALVRGIEVSAEAKSIEVGDGDDTAEETPAKRDDEGQLRFPFAKSSSTGGRALAQETPERSGVLWNSGSVLEQAGYRFADVEAEPPAPLSGRGRLILGITGALASDGGPSRLGDWLATRHDGGSWPVRPLRIGLDLPSDQAAMLIRASADLGIEWVPVAAGGEDRAECVRRCLDGVVRMDAVGDVRLATAEHPEREAGWYDWARPMPMSYSAVFPMRIDPCIVTLSRGWGFDPPDARVIARLIQAAAVLSRSRPRLGLGDRLWGRRPLDLAGGRGAGADLQSLLIGSVSRLAESVCTDRKADGFAMKAAARVVGAWATTTDFAIDPEIRREAAEASLRVLEGEPGAILRAVAARFAAYDDGAAFAGIAEAERAIRESEQGPILDPVAFLEAELELGLSGAMTFGRVAAGLCLVCATTEDARLDYVCDDLAEEMRYSGWLIGRDADRRTLIDVMRAVQRSRRGDGARQAA
jgi:hypothetical protein